MHKPVLLRESLEFLNPKSGGKYIDATADGGGHAIELLKKIQPRGKLLLLEWDETMFHALEERLQKECSRFSKNCVLRNTSYRELATTARSLKFNPAMGVLFDLGLSSFHLEASKRGFSFQKDEPLDMRYSTKTSETARDILTRRSEHELEHIFKEFGEERFSRPIAEAIARSRREQPIRTTKDLIEIIRRSVPAWYRRSRIHFATRVFQALRIATNHELENIPRGLDAACEVVGKNGRIVVISFHSLEDRIVKNFFREDAIKKSFQPLFKKPVRPSAQEISENPRARSAVLRAFERTV